LNTSFTISRFSQKDIYEVIELLQDVSSYRPNVDIIPSLANIFDNQENSYSCVVIKNGKLIGFGSIFFVRRLRGGLTAIIEDVVVAASDRRKGVGQAIIYSLLDVARERNCFKVSLEANQSAEPFYLAAGFVKAGRVMKFML
jgi:GNAT superfamily N-acetyltransferase